MTDKDTLVNLIDEYAEVRHINGCWVYNTKTAAARQAVIEALSGVQALGAAPVEVADAMADSQYLAGVSAGWNAANADDPNEALRKLHESRAGYLKPIRTAARALALSAAPEAIAKLRHLYKNLMCNGVRSTEDAKRIAQGLLAPAIEALERATPPAGQQAAPKAAPGEQVNGWPVEATIYKRRDEWVLELSGAINDCAFTCRHTQPGHLQPEDVAGLPLLYSEGIAPQQEVSQDTMYLLRRLLSNQHTLTGPEFRAELEQIVGEAYQQEAQEPVAYIHVPHHTVEGQVPPVVSFEKYQQDYADGIYSTRIPLYAAPQPAPAPLSDPRITAIEQAIRDYHYALDCRKHGGVAEVQAFGAICDAMKMDWVQGQESERRAALASQGDAP